MNFAQKIFVPLLSILLTHSIYATSYHDDYDDDLWDDYNYFDFTLDEPPDKIFKNITLTKETVLKTNMDNEDISVIKFLDSNITVIPAGPLHVFTNLEEIDFSNCNIQIIESESFSGLHNLKKIYLQENNITEIQQETINDLTSLMEINLSKNNIKKVSANIFENLTELRLLNLSMNNIQSFDMIENMILHPSLLELDLSYNNISELKNNTYMSRSGFLHRIKLNNNNLKDLPWCFFEPIRIEILDLGYNSIETVDFNKFVGIVMLNNNKIKTLTPFGRLYEIDLRYNFIKTIPANILSNATRLSKLEFGHNGIESIHEDSLVGLHILAVLGLNHNNIHEIPVGLFRELKSLHHLSIAYNHIEHLKYGTFEGLKNLATLDLKNNKLSHFEVDVMYPLEHLKHLNINSNSISSFDVNKMMGHFKYFNSFSIDGNNFTCEWLSKSIKVLKNHQFLVVNGTSFKTSNVNGISCDDTNHFLTNKSSVESKPITSTESSIIVQTSEVTNFLTTKSAIDSKPIISTESSIKVQTVGTTTPNATSTESVPIQEPKTENLQLTNNLHETAQLLYELRALLIFVTILITLIILLQMGKYCKKFLYIKESRLGTLRNTNSTSCTLELLHNDND